MSDALVAKSYQGLEQVSDIYEVNGKQYVKVRMKNGSTKQVRAYTEAEYRKYNPEVKIVQKAKSQRETFGFGEEGYIWIFKGDTYAALDWFRAQPTRYARMLGWYLPSNIEMPDPIPAGVTPIKLMWENVCNEEGDHFRPEAEVAAYVETLIYDPGESKWLGEVKDRLTLEVTCTRLFHFMNIYGESTMYMFETNDGDILTWTTQTSKDIEEGHHYVIIGTVKEHITYRNKKQTVLTRCKVVGEIEEDEEE